MILGNEELSYSSNSAVILLEGEYTLPVLINTHNLTLTFNSSNTDVATISSEGIININGNGTTTISAVFAGNSTYDPKTVSYVLVVDIVKYLDYKGLSTFKEKLDEEREELENSISNVNTRVDQLQIVNVKQISTNTNSSCSITGAANSGKTEYVIYTNSSSSDVIITVPTTYLTPSGADLILTCKPTGYCEVSYINSNGVIYARGL